MRVHDLLPAGVPLGFVRARYRIARLFSEAPLLFLGVVIGVALVFRVGIGAIRTASADEEPPPQATTREAPRVARPGASLSVRAEDDPTIKAKKSSSPPATALDMPADKLTPAASATVPHRAKARARRHP